MARPNRFMRSAGHPCVPRLIMRDVETLGIAGLLEENLALREHIARLETLALTDPLTDIPNRRALRETMLRETARCERTGEALCVAVIDLNDFKPFNDEKGHLAGDILLKHCAEAWSHALRPSDVLARIGGDEFGVVLPGCGREEAERILQRMLDATPMGQTASGGIGTWIRGEDIEEAWRAADDEMYRNKGAKVRLFRRRGVRPVGRQSSRERMVRP